MFVYRILYFLGNKRYMENRMKRLILIRHATTIANERRILSGKSETEISEKGFKEIKLLNNNLEKIILDENIKIDKIYISNSSRTESTIKYFSEKENIDLEKIEGLSEIDFGDFEGKDFEYIKKEHPEEFNKLCTEGFEYKYPNGENGIEAYEKNKKAVEFILNDMQENQTSIVCAHGGSIRNILSYLINNTYMNHWNFKIDNAKISIVEVDFGFSVLTKLNN